MDICNIELPHRDNAWIQWIIIRSCFYWFRTTFCSAFEMDSEWIYIECDWFVLFLKWIWIWFQLVFSAVEMLRMIFNRFLHWARLDLPPLVPPKIRFHKHGNTFFKTPLKLLYIHDSHNNSVYGFIYGCNNNLFNIIQ